MVFNVSGFDFLAPGKNVICSVDAMETVGMPQVAACAEQACRMAGLYIVAVVCLNVCIILVMR